MFTWIVFLLRLASISARFVDIYPSQTTFVFRSFNVYPAKGIPRGAPLSAVLDNNCDRKPMSLQTYSAPAKMVPYQISGPVPSFCNTFFFSVDVRRPGVPAEPGGGDGFAFLVTPSGTGPGSAAMLPGKFLSMLNFTATSDGYEHVLALELDSPDANSYGFDLTDIWDAKYWRPLNFTGGYKMQVWIDYDNGKTLLNVTVTPAGEPRPVKPLFSLRMDLSKVANEWIYVGFSLSTGDRWNPPRSFLSKISGIICIGVIATISVGVAVAIAAVVWARVKKKKKRKRQTQGWGIEFWPHRFSYRDLSVATKGFSENMVLGHGGFGCVYRGNLPSSGVEVAVKCITQGFEEGIKGFMAEIASMGRLQHRNLVHIRGWCRWNRQLFIVYDFMRNGSLDKLLFGNPTQVLRWSRRYNILKGVAAGLLYLHEQWEKRVVHRDIKSSNVLLDSELNARLADFGLARLYERNENPQTTHVVGTLGYIAPELIHTGKATPSSDVFSFGALLLEVACGRRPVDVSKDPGQEVIVKWVCDLYAKNRVLDAADPRLCGEFDREEMLKVLKLGLCCSHPAPERRLCIRQVSQILEGEASFPVLDVASFEGKVATPTGSYVDTSETLFYSAEKALACKPRRSAEQEH